MLWDISSPTKKAKPFKLWFSSSSVPGTSHFRIDVPLNLPEVVAPKFYSKYESEYYKVSPEDIERFLKLLDVKGPREKYPKAMTENERYGWYQIRLCDTDKSDRRLHFTKHTDPLIFEQLMNYAKIR